VEIFNDILYNLKVGRERGRKENYTPMSNLNSGVAGPVPFSLS